MMWALRARSSLLRRFLSCRRTYCVAPFKVPTLPRMIDPVTDKWLMDLQIQDPALFTKLDCSPTLHQAVKTCLPSEGSWSATMKLQVLSMLSIKAIFTSRFIELLTNKAYIELRSSLMASIDSVDKDYLAQFLSLSMRSGNTIDPLMLEAIVNVLSREDSLTYLPDKSLGIVSMSMLRLTNKNYPIGILTNIANEVVRRIKIQTFNSQGLADVCHSLGVTIGIPQHAVSPIIDYLVANIDSFNARFLSTIVWSVQKTYVWKDSKMPATLENAMTKIVGDDLGQKHPPGMQPINNRDLETLVYCLGKSCCGSNSFYKSITESILSGKASKQLSSPRFIATLLYAYQRARYYHPEVMEYLALKALDVLSQANCYDVINLVHSYAFLNHPHEALMNATTEHVLQLYNRGMAKLKLLIPTMHSVAWSSLVCGGVSPKLFDICLNTELLNRSKRDAELSDYMILQLDIASRYCYPDDNLPRLTPEHRLAIILYKLRFLENNLMDVGQFNSNVQESLEKMLHHVPDCVKSEAVTFSGLSMDFEILLGEGNVPISVSSCGRNMCYEDVRDLWAGEQGVAVDYIESRLDQFKPRTTSRGLLNLASDWNVVKEAVSEKISRRIALEPNGPTHYASNISRHSLGRVVLKHKLLQAQGWEIIPIHYQDWHRDKNKQIEHIKEKILEI